MADEDQIMRCLLCKKPFSKESTLKRHGYYCRSRKGSERITRARACVACAKAKAKCDNLPMACGRCTSKTIPCVYRSRKVTREHTPDSSCEELESTHDFTKSLSSAAMSPETAKSVAINETNQSGHQDALTGLDLSMDIEDPFEWGLVDFGSPKLHAWDYRKSPVPIAPMPFDLALSRIANDYNPDQMSSMLEPSIPTMPTYEMRCFTRKPALKGGSQATAIMMTRILTSFPLMMRNLASPPPFVHPFCLKIGMDMDHKPLESLTTCASLMQLLGSGGDANRRLVWKNIHLECERLHAEWPLLDKWALLASMQALLLYMLLRLSEGEQPHNNFDVPLLSALWLIACALNQRIDNFACTSPLGLSHGATHEDWIFEESRRRFSVTFRCLSMLFTTDPAGACILFDGFLLAPLPARKALWEASDGAQWAAEKREGGNGGLYGIKMGGKMLRMDGWEELDGCMEMHGSTEGDSDKNWAEWCAGMDGLGALVMLAASLNV
ncbi:hypothetical protein CC86DRAFT_348301 [Ophiobolus disseminans]|uniref:Zn(2)-C6 fungal-type domain-containing protein n=1 Tax=Ophiobolus disseminans TaxID=1469910 RepID=A0A6A7A4I4_9PLEO|nr:hypothetical protein CC86DRAFT_348301 [Ophiobolus disseminans]